MKPVIIILAFALCVAHAFAEPTNLSIVKQQLQQYHDSGAYGREISAVIDEANYYLKFRINQNKHVTKPQKLAVVLDIDETSLSNYAVLKHFDFGGTYMQIKTAIDQGHDPAIAPTLKLFNFAEQHGVAVFFITGRDQAERASTSKNLHNAGYNHWQGLMLEPNTYSKSSPTPFKVAMRKQIISEGYDIVLNIGDQYSDLKGNYADMDFKLPNPFYLTA